MSTSTKANFCLYFEFLETTTNYPTYDTAMFILVAATRLRTSIGVLRSWGIRNGEYTPSPSQTDSE